MLRSERNRKKEKNRVVIFPLILSKRSVKRCLFVYYTSFFLLFSFKEEGKKKLVGESCIVMDKIKELSFCPYALPLFFGIVALVLQKH